VTTSEESKKSGLFGELNPVRLLKSNGNSESWDGYVSKNDIQQSNTQNWRVLEKIPGQLEALFPIFLTLGLTKQSNTTHNFRKQERNWEPLQRKEEREVSSFDSLL